MSVHEINIESTSNLTPACPLCQNKVDAVFHTDKHRTFFRCPICDLTFIAPEQRLTKQQEKAQYELHQNNPQDPSYRTFLSRLFEPMKQRITRASSGLDFGSGPGPTLSLMFEEVGHPMNIFDPFYAPDPQALSHTYDFITTSEVVEHLYNPKADLEKLWTCLKPGGWLGIMTKLALDLERFKQWHYRTEATHVCFFSKTTFQFIANAWNAKLIFIDQDVILLQKPVE